MPVTNLDGAIDAFLINKIGGLIDQYNSFSGSSGFSVTITPTASVASFFIILRIHWVIDTALASGGTTVSAQIFFQVNGVDRIRWTSIFSELIIDDMDDVGYFFTANGTNNISFGISLGTLNLANGYLHFQGFYQ